MDVSYVNPFVVSTIETLQKMLNIEGKAGKLSLKDSSLHSYDVTGVIGLTGEAAGSICLSFPQEVAFKAVTALLGMPVTMMGDEVTDGIGELVNIVAGNAKQYLTKYNLSISLPKVVVGRNHSVASMSGVPTIVVPIVSSLGEFAMEISLKTPEVKK
ncbi:MAG: chemotaxis protein CheX [Chitinispirillia bacterium]|nr:chemotaxis protein CheX [Chitinispirillia bacterium]MCL2268665.1 chemotaxis protein CheX [Chitinispirillia bacterium]